MTRPANSPSSDAASATSSKRRTWREQAELNHGQTLERLNERGGLAPEELWLAAHGHGALARPPLITESEAGRWLIRVAEPSR